MTFGNYNTFNPYQTFDTAYKPNEPTAGTSTGDPRALLGGGSLLQNALQGQTAGTPQLASPTSTGIMAQPTQAQPAPVQNAGISLPYGGAGGGIAANQAAAPAIDPSTMTAQDLPYIPGLEQMGMEFGQRAWQDRPEVAELMSMLQQRAAGEVPSAAEMQLRDTLQQQNALAQGQARGMTGVNPALANRMAADVINRQGQQASNQANILRAQEQETATNQLQNLNQFLGNQDTQRQGMNDAMQQQFFGLAAQARAGDLNAQMQLEQLLAGNMNSLMNADIAQSMAGYQAAGGEVADYNANRNNSFVGGLVETAGPAIGAVSSLYSGGLLGGGGGGGTSPQFGQAGYMGPTGSPVAPATAGQGGLGSYPQPTSFNTGEPNW